MKSWLTDMRSRYAWFRKRRDRRQGLSFQLQLARGFAQIEDYGGETRKILFRRAGAKVEYLNESWMPSAAEMGMSDQDLVDLAVYLQTTGSEAPPATPHLDEPVPPIGNEPGWQS